MPQPIDRADVAILGGGLAGLTLALQLRQQQPDLSVAVIERRAHPVREAAHKVGESTVEIGAYYFADVLGLRGEVAGLIIFLCLTWDGLVDPAIGILANRTRTRWGKYRPFLLFGSIPLAASFAFMFAPTGLEGAALIGYAFATQILFRTMYGLVNIPYSALMATMTRDSMQRNWLAGTRMIFAFLGTAVVSYFTPRLVTYFTSGGRTAGYFGATAVLAALATVFTIVTFLTTREDSSITHAKEQPPPVRELLRMVAQNVPFLQIIAGIAAGALEGLVHVPGKGVARLRPREGEDSERTRDVPGEAARRHSRSRRDPGDGRAVLRDVTVRHGRAGDQSGAARRRFDPRHGRRAKRRQPRVRRAQ